MTREIPSPDERAVRAHLDGGRFRAGIAAGYWRLIRLTWPYILIGVSAAERACGPAEWVLRLELTGYPHSAPTGSLWDEEADVSLAHDKRPKGLRAAQLFRSDGWIGGPTAMYAPWDRLGLQAHPNWASVHRMQAWDPTRDLSFVLEQVHEVLNADDYLGA